MKNKLLMSSMSTIIGLYGVLILFLLIVFEIVGLPLASLLIVSIIFLGIQFLVAPFFTDLIMKIFYKADFHTTIPEYLVSFINQVCSEHNMKYPKIGYIDDGAPNAFTYGRTKNDARIVLTRGIFDLLTPEEVKTVVAHEMGHAVHYDMFFMTIAQIIPLILRWIYEMTIRANSKGKDSKAKDYAAIIGIIAYILHVITQYVILWFSRTREYYADLFAVQKTKDPSAMSSALVKVGYGLVTANQKADDGKKKVDISSVSALGIFDSKSSKSLVVSSYNEGQIETDSIKKAARWELWNPWATWFEIHSTHPRISKRLKAIASTSHLYNQNPYIVFDEQKPESYVDDFLMEVFIYFLPVIIIIATIFTAIYLSEENGNLWSLIIGIGILFLSLANFIKLKRSYKNKDYVETNIANLLGEVKVSQVTSIPCILKGTFIGKGSPGYIFSEDFILRDETGIIFIDYKQPLSIMNFFFGLFKAGKYIDKEVVIKGWYKRSPVPYIELNNMIVDGQKKTCYTYGFKIAMIILLLLLGIALTIYGIGIM